VTLCVTTLSRQNERTGQVSYKFSFVQRFFTSPHEAPLHNIAYCSDLGEAVDDIYVSPKAPGGRPRFAHNSYSAGYSAVKDPRIHGNVGSKLEVDIPPDRHELFLLSEGEKKITFEPETREFTVSCTEVPVTVAY